MPVTIAALKAAWGGALLLYSEVKPFKERGAFTLCTASFGRIVLQRQSFWVNNRTGLLQRASPMEQGTKPTVNHHNTLFAWTEEACNHISKPYPSSAFFSPSNLWSHLKCMLFQLQGLQLVYMALKTLRCGFWPQEMICGLAYQKNKVQGCPLLYTCARVAGTTSLT